MLCDLHSVVTCRNLEDSEKDYLRGQLLQLILEEDSQVSAVGVSSARLVMHEQEASMFPVSCTKFMTTAGSWEQEAMLTKYFASVSQQALPASCKA